MRAVVVPQYGEAAVLRLAEMPVPRAEPGHVVVRQSFAGVNFADIYQRNGLYHGEHTYGTQPPFVLGFEGAGLVEAVGEGVTRFRPGQPVGYALGRGGYAELVAVEERKVVALPEGLPPETAAALMLQGSTAHYLTHSLFELRAGNVALVHAAAGGVGRLLVQLGRAKGARMLAVVGSREKAEAVLALGAEAAIVRTEEDLVERVRELTGGEGVDVAYDSVGQATIAKSLRCLKVRGTCVLFGASSGPVASVTPMDLAEAGSVFFTRPHLAHYRRTAEEAEARVRPLFDLALAGRLSVRIDSRHPLENAADAHRRLEGGQSSGKVLLQI
jgi:NADPH2:quinone reductase